MARELGKLLAEDGWVILTGGRDAGVMRAVNHGAKEVTGNLTVGVLPSAATEVATSVDVAIITDMNEARNNINVLSSRVVVAFGQGGPGTVSEVALALKAGKPVILLAADEVERVFFERLGNGSVQFVESAADAVAAARRFRCVFATVELLIINVSLPIMLGNKRSYR